jgi:hypothetical protein
MAKAKEKVKVNKFRLRWSENREGNHGSEWVSDESEDFPDRKSMDAHIQKVKKYIDFIPNSIEWVKLIQAQITEWDEGRGAYVRRIVDVEVE